MADPPTPPTQTLSLDQAAEALGVSRTHVRMLCDAGRLTTVDAPDGAQPRVLRESVDLYIERWILPNQGAPCIREAGLEAKMYVREDADCGFRRVPTNDDWRKAVRGVESDQRPSDAAASEPVMGYHVLGSMPYSDDPTLGEIAPAPLPNPGLPKSLDATLKRDLDSVDDSND